MAKSWTISILFDRDVKTIGKHINNALKEELDAAVVARFVTTAKDGKTYQVEYYNLDMIISAGYRVKSQNGIIFRRWANKILKDYMIKCYAVNERRLAYLEKTVKLLDIASRSNETITGDEAKDIISVINNYTKALNIYRTLKKIKSNKDDLIITYEECLEVIDKLRFNNESKLFALERDNNFKAILGYLSIIWHSWFI